MSGTRPNIFGEDDFDLSGFSPKSGPEKLPVPPEVLERISEETGLPSRAPKPRAPARPLLQRRPIAAKSGRTVLLNARIRQEAHDRFHEILERERLRYEAGELTHRVTLGELVERALAALEHQTEQGTAKK
jgi:hypothetical protein